MTKPEMTHKGWLGLCPIYLTDPTQGPLHLEARHWVLEPLLDLSEALQRTVNWLLSLVDPHHEPGFSILVTGVRR